MQIRSCLCNNRQLLSGNSAATTTVSYSLGNSSAKVYRYSVVVTLDAGTITGDFRQREYWRAETNAASPSVDVVGTVVAYDPLTREIEIDVNYAQTSDVLEVGDVVALWTAETGGNRTGDKGVVSSIERQLRTYINDANANRLRRTTLSTTTTLLVSPKFSLRTF